MQVSPAGQSADVWQAAWHLPQVHTRPWLQSLLRTHVPPTSIFIGELQPAASDVETTIKPRTRCHDADISIIQVCFGCRRSWAPRRYHSGTGGCGLSLSRSGISASLVPARLAEKTEDSRHVCRGRSPALVLQVQSSKATCTRSATPAAIGWHPDSGRAADAPPRPVGSGAGAVVCRTQFGAGN